MFNKKIIFPLFFLGYHLDVFSEESSYYHDVEVCSVYVRSLILSSDTVQQTVKASGIVKEKSGIPKNTNFDVDVTFEDFNNFGLIDISVYYDYPERHNIPSSENVGGRGFWVGFYRFNISNEMLESFDVNLENSNEIEFNKKWLSPLNYCILKERFYKVQGIKRLYFYEYIEGSFKKSDKFIVLNDYVKLTEEKFDYSRVIFYDSNGKEHNGWVLSQYLSLVDYDKIY
ncbi:hypothetical protein [Thorsellia kenyensis]|uniref:Uncharacterized protein n=1 Tax=Thorsellia kenyensis TaxID=1549888 RepID=A0ABV6CFK4_9GAMM